MWRAILAGGLEHAVIVAHRLNHLGPFCEGQRHGLLAEDVFTRIGGGDGHGGVPVIRHHNGDHVDAIPVDDFMEVGRRVDAVVAFFAQLFRVELVGDLERRFAAHDDLFVAIAFARRVHIAERTNLDVVVAHEEFHVGRAPGAEADNAHVDAFAGRVFTPGAAG